MYYLHGDHLGSTSLTTDNAGVVVSEVRYHPYGLERWTAGESPTDFGFTSQRKDSYIKLLDYNARYYSPVLGRFVSPDTIVPEPTSSGGFNRYRYVRNNPLKYTDPTGHQECEDENNCNQLKPPLQEDDNKDKGEDTFDFNNETVIQFGVPSRPSIDLDLAEKWAVGGIISDILSLGVSTPSMLAAWGATGLGEAATPVPLADGLAGYIGVAAGYANTLDKIEAGIGGAGAIMTSRSDYLAGNSYRIPGEGVVVGQDTYVAVTLSVVGGFIPEPTLDTVINAAGLAYDIGALAGSENSINSLLPGNLFIRTNFNSPSPQEGPYPNR